jgi:uncharacterized SAM-binding protein YcdF (DUF218 family)
MRSRRFTSSKRLSSRRLSRFVHPPRKRVGFRQRFFGAVLIVLLLGIGLKTLEGIMRMPEAVLVLGGAVEREVFAAQFAQKYPDLPVWVSSGSNPEYAEWVFLEAGLVFGSQGIAFKPVAVPSQHSPEPWGKVLRDAARSISWVVTGRTGASLAQTWYRD